MSNNAFGPLQHRDESFNRTQREIEDEFRRRRDDGLLERTTFSGNYEAKASDRHLVYIGVGNDRLTLAKASDVGAARSAVTFITNRSTGPLYVSPRNGENTTLTSVRPGRVAVIITDADSWRAIHPDNENLTANIASTTNVGAGEDDLHSYTVPVGTLSRTGDYIEAEYSITLAANANAKRVRVRWGGTAIYDSGAGSPNNVEVFIRVNICRAGVGQMVSGTVISSNTATLATTVLRSTQFISMAADIILKVTGEGVANGDITCQLSRVRFAGGPGLQ